MRLMVGIDESDESFYALKWALDNICSGIRAPSDEAGQEGMLLTLVHVHLPYHHYGFPGSGVPATYVPTEVVDSVKKSQEEKAAAILARALQICKDKMIKAETLILDGDPKDKICLATEQMHVDLLILGSHGFGGIKRALLGSVSDYCAHYAKCAVLVVKLPKEEDVTK